MEAGRNGKDGRHKKKAERVKKRLRWCVEARLEGCERVVQEQTGEAKDEKRV